MFVSNIFLKSLTILTIFFFNIKIHIHEFIKLFVNKMFYSTNVRERTFRKYRFSYSPICSITSKTCRNQKRKFTFFFSYFIVVHNEFNPIWKSENFQLRIIYTYLQLGQLPGYHRNVDSSVKDNIFYLLMIKQNVCFHIHSSIHMTLNIYRDYRTCDSNLCIQYYLRQLISLPSELFSSDSTTRSIALMNIFLFDQNFNYLLERVHYIII